MATVTAISTKGGGGGKKSLDYICRDDKTEGKKYVTAINCSLPTAYQEFKNTREMYGKTDGIRYYHFVQSHPSGYKIEPALAHKIAVEFAEKAFNKYEVVVATHIDREHIHSHLVLNSVSFEDGKKYHSNKESVEELMKLSDEICQKYGVHVLDTPKKKMNRDYLSDSEYRSAKRGESFKWELMNAINQVMKQAKTKKQFCYLMKQQGYGVRWEDNRKYITYTCPNKRKCRDNKLHGEKYRKENMEYEFETRRIAADVRQGIVSSGGCSANSGGARFQLESADRIEQADVAGAAGNTHQTLGAGDESNSGPVLTGWETERGIWIEAERARRIQAQAQIESRQVDSDLAVSIDSVVGGVTAVASIIEDEPAEDNEYAREYTDSKALAEERERKEALGIHMG